MNEFDVIVVGGRLAGASTAMLLARDGARVALIERAAYGTDTVSTHGFMRAGVLQLSRWGLLDQVVAAGTPPIRATTFHYSDGESVEVAIRPSPGVDALYAPRRPLIDGIIVDAAAEAGTHIRHGTTVTELLRDDSGRVRGVGTQDRAGRTADLRAAITVGADGIRSTVAEHVDAPFLRQGRFGSATLYQYYDGVETTQYEWAYGANSAAGLIPTNDGLTCVFVSSTPARLRALRREGTERAFDTLLAQAAPTLTARVAAAQPAGRLHGWAGHPGFLRLSRGAGWALVGDAGYFKDPLTTHGMTDALRDAELLSNGILETLSGVTPEAVALARYGATRDRLSQRLFDATESVASYAWDLVEVRALVRNVSAAMTAEVEHLEALPARRVGGGPSATARPEQARS